MNKNIINSYKNIYFVGIGGISMSGLAEIMLSRNINVSGSDIKESKITQHLKSLGIKINIGQKYENITNDIDLIVYTAAVKAENEEIISAKDKGITIIDRAELLGALMSDYENSIAVSGTHGKTTTTSMISEILLLAQTDPTISIGGILPSIGGNTRIGAKKYFVAEACEYFDSFLKFNPFIAIILNIEADHLDYFKTFENVQKSFKNFAGKVPQNGTLIINSEIENLNYIISDLKCNIIKIGLHNDLADWKAENIIHEKDGKNTFEAFFKGKYMGTIHLNVPGNHNIINSLCACAAAYQVGIPIDKIIEGLKNYKGTNRRFQYKGSLNGALIIDDYAHHPTEIKATLLAAKNFKHNKIRCIFQPHTYSRTKSFFNDFVNSFENADEIIFADIYAAREKDNGEVSSKQLAQEVKHLGKDAKYISSFKEIEKYLIDVSQKDDLIITMGAGDVYLIGEDLVNNQKNVG